MIQWIVHEDKKVDRVLASKSPRAKLRAKLRIQKAKQGGKLVVIEIEQN